MTDQTIPLKMDPSGILAELVDDDYVHIKGNSVYVGDVQMDIAAFFKFAWKLLLLLDGRLAVVEEKLGIDTLGSTAIVEEIAKECFNTDDADGLGYEKAKGVFNAIRNIRANREKNRSTGTTEE